MKVIIIVFVIILANTKVAAQKQDVSNNAPGVGYYLAKNKPFAELELEDTSGKGFNTASLLGKTIYVDFWFTNCPPCIKEIPWSIALQNYFRHDTSIVFLNICIENVERKPAWRQMVKEKEMQGIQLFYARNRPQKINLLREYDITFPTYLIVNKAMKVVGCAPRPSEVDRVRFVIEQVAKF